jgi:chromosome segregation ATPase
MGRRIDVAVKDKCYALLFKIDALERKLEASRKELADMERVVRERLKVEFEDLVKDLSTQLTMVRSQFKEYRESLQQDMKSNLHEIRKEALMKIVKQGSAPIELKRMTLKMAHTEDTIEDLTIENSELKRALLKVRTMNTIKDMSSKVSYDKRLKNVEAEREQASRQLYQDKTETQKQLTILQSRLHETNSALTAAESERDKLRKELDLANRNKQSLLTWKVAKTQLLADMESRVKKYEKWSHHDVDKLLLDIEKKDAEIRHLNAQDPDSLRRHRNLMDSSARKELDKLRRQLQVLRPTFPCPPSSQLTCACKFAVGCVSLAAMPVVVKSVSPAAGRAEAQARGVRAARGAAQRLPLGGVL